MIGTVSIVHSERPEMVRVTRSEERTIGADRSLEIEMNDGETIVDLEKDSEIVIETDAMTGTRPEKVTRTETETGTGTESHTASEIETGAGVRTIINRREVRLSEIV